MKSRLTTPWVQGHITAEQIEVSADSIAEWQLPNGMVQWVPGGHADPWNHVESLMAMATCGLIEEAELGYQWLYDLQRHDGSWHNYYTADGIEDSKLDSNCVAYVATGVWHHWLVTQDRGFIETYWPVVERAMEFVLDLQTKNGGIIWARHSNGRPWSYALLTGSSSISHSIRCASLLAAELGNERPDWVTARHRLVDLIANEPEAFEPKARWAMDWYYPVLTGAVVGEQAIALLDHKWDTFIMANKGVRCVSDRPWITAAETCECSMAHAAVGDLDRATELFGWAQKLRDDEGRYFTGLVFPELVYFPDMERSTYTAAAVILAADALYGQNPTSDLFTRHS